MASYPVNLVGPTKKLSLVLFANLVHTSLLSIKSDISKLGAGQEVKLIAALRSGIISSCG